MDLAVASGYSLRYIGDIERGAKSATMRTMHDLATLLEIRLSALVVEAESLWERDSKTEDASRRPNVKFPMIPNCSNQETHTESPILTRNAIIMVRFMRGCIWPCGRSRKQRRD
jgi:hypothetical protein